MAETTPNAEPIRIFDVQDRMFTLRVFAYSSLIGMGISFISISVAFQLAVPTAPAAVQQILTLLRDEYLIAGLIGFGIGLGGGLVERLNIHKVRVGRQPFRMFNPRSADPFVVVIEGVGSHGNPEREGHVDNIMELAIRNMIANGNSVSSARFYSSAGVRNLLNHQL